MDKDTKKFLKGMYGLLSLEDLFPHHIRRSLMHIFGSASLILVVVVLFGNGVVHNSVRGGLFLCLSISLFLFSLEAYFYSIVSRALALEYRVPFDVGQILFYAEGNDLTEALVFSDIGDEALRRLGLSEEDIKNFLVTREDSTLTEPLSSIEGHTSFEEFFKLIYENDKGLGEFLFSKGVQESEFLGALMWVITRERNRISSERFWSRENLSKIPGIGKNWSYGETYTLDKYGRDVTEETIDLNEEYITSQSKVTERIQNILLRGNGSNVVLYSDDDNSRMDTVLMLARNITQGTALLPLQHKRVFVITPNIIVENITDKISFEREFAFILEEVEHAQNVILVIPDFGQFMQSVKYIGVEILGVLAQFVKSPYVHLILLDSTKNYHELLSDKDVIKENFEIIEARGGDESSLRALLLSSADKIELTAHVLITYPAITAIIADALRYFEPSQKVQKAGEMLVEVVQYALSLGRKVVYKDDVSHIVEIKTGIPVAAPEAKERDMLVHLEDLLHERIIGQSEAVKVISEALKRNRAGIQNPDKPIGTFLFLGPTGVGKTETTKALASIMFKDESKITRFDMGEYRDAMALERLIGSFGQSSQGTLSVALRENPYGILLLDEFEKTTNDVINLFLRVFDEGVFTDSLGRKVNAKNNIIIATSNAGSEIIWDIAKDGGDLAASKDKILQSIIDSGVYKPELLNRFDAVILFHPLTTSDLKSIGTLMIKKLAKRMKERGVIIDATNSFMDYLVSKANDPKFGARPMNRAINDEVEKIIADKIITGTIKTGSKVIFDIDATGQVVCI